MAKGTASKANFKGYDAGLIQSPKGEPDGSITQSFKGNNTGPSKYDPLVGCGSDSRPRFDDNQLGKNRWPMGENKPKDVSNASISFKS